MRNRTVSVAFFTLLTVVYSCKKQDAQPCAPFTLSESLLGVYVSDSLYNGFDYASTPYVDEDTAYYQPETINVSKGCGTSLVIGGYSYLREYTDSTKFCKESFNPSVMHSSGTCVRYVNATTIRKGSGSSGPGYNSWSIRYYYKQ